MGFYTSFLILLVMGRGEACWSCLPFSGLVVLIALIFLILVLVYTLLEKRFMVTPTDFQWCRLVIVADT
jgi:hypothetical protein